jgi:hypothetical protein
MLDYLVFATKAKLSCSGVMKVKVKRYRVDLHDLRIKTLLRGLVHHYHREAVFGMSQESAMLSWVSIRLQGRHKSFHLADARRGTSKVPLNSSFTEGFSQHDVNSSSGKSVLSSEHATRLKRRLSMGSVSQRATTEFQRSEPFSLHRQKTGRKGGTIDSPWTRICGWGGGH